MKKIIFLISFLSLNFFCQSQTYLKGNMLYWALGITNIGVETKLGERWTFNSDLVYSPWKSFEGNHFEFFQIIPEFRFYTKKSFDGFYLGSYGSFQLFNITKWNYWNKGVYQKGRGFSWGVSLGYSYLINSKLGLDVYLGVGRQASKYRGYISSTGEEYVGWNGSGEWVIYKIGITFTYRL